MGFFGDIWNGLKSAGRAILDVGKKVGNAVLDGGNWIRNKINTGVDFARKIPFLGGLVDRAINAPVVDGVSLSQIGNVADSALDAGNGVRDLIDAANRGEWDKAVKEGTVAYNAGKDVRDKFNESMNKRREILGARN